MRRPDEISMLSGLSAARIDGAVDAVAAAVNVRSLFMPWRCTGCVRPMVTSTGPWNTPITASGHQSASLWLHCCCCCCCCRVKINTSLHSSFPASSSPGIFITAVINIRKHITRLYTYYCITNPLYSGKLTPTFRLKVPHILEAPYIHRKEVILAASTPAVPVCCCSNGSAPYWSNPLFLIFDIRALWRSVLSARVPKCQKLKIVG